MACSFATIIDNVKDVENGGNNSKKTSSPPKLLKVYETTIDGQPIAITGLDRELRNDDNEINTHRSAECRLREHCLDIVAFLPRGALSNTSITYSYSCVNCPLFGK